MPSAFQRLAMRFVNLYPPFLGMAIRVSYPKDDPYAIVVTAPLRLRNRNLFGTHFGGSLYAMADPFFVFILMKHLGAAYLVWDKRAAIEFLRPGRGRVTGRYRVPPEEIARVKALADAGETVEPVYVGEIRAEDGELVARVTKTLWIRKKTKAA
ncbi:MAG TPA: YiiD C-terminal domain-containing protein [Thermoanaerobaculia bacterium]|nr:YiiD C-terminal domain-containing protein [Thermoanaerobaculia bacterium]